MCGKHVNKTAFQQCNEFKTKYILDNFVIIEGQIKYMYKVEEH